MPKAKSKDLGALAGGKVRFIEPMHAKPVQELPEGSEWQRGFQQPRPGERGSQRYVACSGTRQNATPGEALKSKFPELAAGMQEAY